MKEIIKNLKFIEDTLNSLSMEQYQKDCNALHYALNDLKNKVAAARRMLQEPIVSIQDVPATKQL